MTFTPGSDEDRTDTIEAQREGLGLDPETGEALDKNRTEREFYEASQGLRDANTAFQRFLGIIGALQNNAIGIVGTIADSIGKDNYSIVTPEQPIIEDVPQYPVVLQRILKVKKDNPEAFSGIVGSIGKDNTDPEEELKKARDQYEAENQQIYDEVTKGNELIRRNRRRKSKISPGQLYIDFTYSNVNEEIEKPLSEEDLTDEELIRYGQMNAESAIDIEDYLGQFGASTVSRKRIRTSMLQPFKDKYGATDEQVKEYVKLANRNTRDIEATIKYLNYEYKLSQPAANIEDIAAEMSLVFGQTIAPETIDNIIKGQGGEILYQTDGMKRRNEPAISITNREQLIQAYVQRLNLLNTHGAFDKGHVYAADQILKDNKVSNASMYRNLEPEIRASIQQLVSPVELRQLISGQLTKGTDYIDVIIGNRSKKAGGDPADKIFERLYGNAYGLEEDFKNFLFPNQNLANMIHPDLKPLFGRKYTNLVKKKVKEREGIQGAGPTLKVGSHSLNIIRLEAMQEVLEDYVEGTEITEEEKKAQDSLARVQAFLDFVTQKDMVNREGEAKRGDE